MFSRAGKISFPAASKELDHRAVQHLIYAQVHDFARLVTIFPFWTSVRVEFKTPWTRFSRSDKIWIYLDFHFKNYVHSYAVLPHNRSVNLWIRLLPPPHFFFRYTVQSSVITECDAQLVVWISRLWYVSHDPTKHLYLVSSCHIMFRVYPRVIVRIEQNVVAIQPRRV